MMLGSREEFVHGRKDRRWVGLEVQVTGDVSSETASLLDAVIADIYEE